MALAGIVIETPALSEVGLPIQVESHDIQHEINAAGTFAVSFPATQGLAKQVRSRWRVSIVEEGRTDYLLYRGIVLQRNYHVNVDGTGILSLTGYSRLYALTAESTHLGLAYDGSQTIEDIANDLASETVAVPASASTITPTVTFNETSKLEALLKACELARYNLRETWESGDDYDEAGFELVEQDDVPDSGFRFINVQQAGPELENAAENGIGLIAGTPTIGYNGTDLATRIIPIGADFDGKPLTLGSSNKTTPYTIQSALNPDGTTYHYLEDAAAVEVSGVVELQYVRSDVKNPSDDAGTRQAAANVLYALAAGELIKRRYDVVSFACEIANGRHIDALPGDRVRIQFRGIARTPYGALTWQDIDQDFLIAKRRDSSTAAGVRGVSFTLTAPEVPMTIPDLPDAVPIPPSPRDPPDPPYPGDNGGDNGGDGGGDTGGDTAPEDIPPLQDPGIPDPGALPTLTNPIGTGVPYQPCCAHPTDITDGAKDPPGVHGGGGDYETTYFTDIPRAYHFDGNWFPGDHVLNIITEPGPVDRPRTIFWLHMHGATPQGSGWNDLGDEMWYRIAEEDEALGTVDVNLIVSGSGPSAECAFTASVYKSVIGTGTAPITAGWAWNPNSAFDTDDQLTESFAIKVDGVFSYLTPSPLNGFEQIDHEETVTP